MTAFMRQRCAHRSYRGREAGPDRVITGRQREMQRRLVTEVQRVLMFGQQLARLGQKHLPVLRQPKVAWRAVYQPSAEALLQHLQFLADDGLHGPRSLGRPRQATQFDGENEEAHAFKVNHMKSL